MTQESGYTCLEQPAVDFQHNKRPSGGESVPTAFVPTSWCLVFHPAHRMPMDELPPEELRLREWRRDRRHSQRQCSVRRLLWWGLGCLRLNNVGFSRLASPAMYHALANFLIACFAPLFLFLPAHLPACLHTLSGVLQQRPLQQLKNRVQHDTLMKLGQEAQQRASFLRHHPRCYDLSVPQRERETEYRGVLSYNTTIRFFRNSVNLSDRAQVKSV